MSVRRLQKLELEKAFIMALAGSDDDYIVNFLVDDSIEVINLPQSGNAPTAVPSLSLFLPLPFPGTVYCSRNKSCLWKRRREFVVHEAFFFAKILKAVERVSPSFSHSASKATLSSVSILKLTIVWYIGTSCI